MHGKGDCMAGGHVWQGACMAGGVCGVVERQPLQQTVRILLECILVDENIH